LAGLPVELVPQGSLGIAEAEEPHATFIENALAKARHAAQGLRRRGHRRRLGPVRRCARRRAGCDLGALRAGAGCRWVTARRSAACRTRQQRLLLQRLRAASSRPPRATSSARWWRVRHAPTPQPLVAFGPLARRDPRRAAGEGGFGYDPLMFIPISAAAWPSWTPRLKNAHSHRARPVAQMRTLLREAWRLG
jgi:XTP/dITP diphosphohydrolase